MTNPARPELLTIAEAAVRLDVQPGDVRRYIHQRLLRLATPEPAQVWASDVERLRRVLARQQGRTLLLGA